MQKILNITNGDFAVDLMKQAKILGVFLPWRDVLHDGPVPEGLSLEELSNVRAKFISDRGWGEYSKINRDFVDRDNQLKSFADYDKVVLWFEHDLYDQLQILQILHWFSEQNISDSGTEISIIFTDRYLGMLAPEDLVALLSDEQVVSSELLELANQCWNAFRAPTPERWYGLLKKDTSALPHLKAAIVRLLAEYPSASNGLSRTAHKALKIISKDVTDAGKVFALFQESEERRFLGDSSFWIILQECIASNPALLSLPKDQVLTLPTTKEQSLTITTTGKAVLKRKQNMLHMMTLDKWIGGVHLTKNNIWCWDDRKKRIRKQG